MRFSPAVGLAHWLFCRFFPIVSSVDILPLANNVFLCLLHRLTCPFKMVFIMRSRYFSLALYLITLLAIFAAVPGWPDSIIGSCRQVSKCSTLIEAGFSTLTSCCNNPSRSLQAPGDEQCVECSGYDYRDQSTLELQASRFAADGEEVTISCRFSTPPYFAGGIDIDGYPAYNLSVHAGGELLESRIGSGFGNMAVLFNTTIHFCPPSSRKIRCQSDLSGVFLLPGDSSLLKNSTQDILIGDDAPFEWIAQPGNLTVCPGSDACFPCHFNGAADNIYWDKGEDRGWTSVCDGPEGYEGVPTELYIQNITLDMTIGCHVDTGLGSIHSSRRATITVREGNDPVCLPAATGATTTEATTTEAITTEAITTEAITTEAITTEATTTGATITGAMTTEAITTEATTTKATITEATTTGATTTGATTTGATTTEATTTGATTTGATTTGATTTEATTTGAITTGATTNGVTTTEATTTGATTTESALTETASAEIVSAAPVATKAGSASLHPLYSLLGLVSVPIAIGYGIYLH